MQDITSDEIINDRNTKTSQYPPLSGPIRRILPSFFNFSKFHLTPSVVSPTSAASSFLVDLGLFISICKIFWVVSIVFFWKQHKTKRVKPPESRRKTKQIQEIQRLQYGRRTGIRTLDPLIKSQLL